MYVSIKLIFIFNPSYQCIRLKRWYLRVSIDHPEKQTIRQEPFSWATKKFDMSSKSIKKDQNENWAPTIRGVGRLAAFYKNYELVAAFDYDNWHYAIDEYCNLVIVVKNGFFSEKKHSWCHWIFMKTFRDWPVNWIHS